MRIIPSVICYIEKEGKFLLLRREKPPDRGKYVAPGGKIKMGEEVYEAVKREVKEETGLNIDRLKYIGTTFHYEEEKTWIVFVFYTRYFKGKIKETREGPLFWFSKEEILGLDLPPGDRYFLTYVFNKELFFGTFWYNKRGELIQYKVQKVG